MKTIQIEAHKQNHNALLKSAGVRRIHPGWYRVSYNGAMLDASTICSARRNHKGEISSP